MASHKLKSRKQTSQNKAKEEELFRNLYKNKEKGKRRNSDFGKENLEKNRK